MNDVFKVLSTVVLIDATAFRKLSTKQLAKAMQDINATGLPQEFVESFSAYRNRREMMPAILRGESINNRVELFREAPLTDDELKALATFREVYQVIENIVKSLPTDSYKFADIPEGKSLYGYTLDKPVIKRSVGDTYSIGAKTLQAVWDKVKDYWHDEKGTTPPKSYLVRASGYERYAEFAQDCVSFGCQRIDRWELEQIALHLGWEFPK